MSWTEIIVYMIALNGVWMGFYASRNNEKLWKRVNFMQDVLIKNGVAGKYDFTLALRGLDKQIHYNYNEEDFYIGKLRSRIYDLEIAIADAKGEQHG